MIDFTRKLIRSRLVVPAAAVLFGLTAMGCEPEVKISADDAKFQKSLQTQLIKAKPGTVIRLPAGNFKLDRTITLKKISGVTIRGAGMNKTILSFKGQKTGAEGIKVSADKFTIEDLTIQDTKGDALKIEKSNGVYIRRVKTEWTRGPHEKNGAYGIYPVQCQNVLVEGSVAIGASDAGIYVGQSKHIVIRKSIAEKNVAGIEIENSTFADVHDNKAIGNTGGILVFDLPDLPVQGGQNTRVFNNIVKGNNEPNFAPSGNIVAGVPTGTGIMVMANDNIEVFNNTISDHKTASFLVVSYFMSGNKIKDKKYDPYPEKIYIHGNKIAKGGYDPTGGNSLRSKATVVVIGRKLGKGGFPQVVWDGVVNKKKHPSGKLPQDQKICIQNNTVEGGKMTFANLDAANDFAKINRNLKDHDCAHPRLKPNKVALAR